MSRSPNPRVIASSVVGLVLVIDQLSKQWALTALAKVGSTVILPGPVDLTLVFNNSNAFGLVPVSGELTRWGLTTLNLVVASLLVRVVVRRATARLATVGFAFIIAGAIGNALDRIRSRKACTVRGFPGRSHWENDWRDSTPMSSASKTAPRRSRRQFAFGEDAGASPCRRVIHSITAAAEL